MNELYEKTELKSLRPLVAFHYPKINPGILDYYIRESMIRFARKSQCMTRILIVPLQKKVCEYILELPDDYLIYEIESVEVNRCCLKNLKESNCGCMSGHYTYRSNKVTLCDVPECEGVMRVRMTVLPSRNTCTVDKELIDAWGDVIAEGVHSKLRNSNDDRWRNLVESRLSERAFLRGVEEAQVHCQRNGVRDKIIHIGTFDVPNCIT